MGFQTLFKFVKFLCASDIVRETVPSSWRGDGKRTLAEFQTGTIFCSRPSSDLVASALLKGRWLCLF